MDQKFITLFDRYTHGGMSRREFLDKLQVLAGSAAAAAAVLPVLENNYAEAAMVAEDDPRLSLTEGEIAPGVKGLLAVPKDAAGKLPGVLVIHENRGLNPHIKDVTRRMALEGFVAFGADFLAPQGGTPADEEVARETIGKLDQAAVETYAKSALAALLANPATNGKAGAVGFCWGGGQVNALAASDPTLSAGVAYYGRQLPDEKVPALKAPLMLHYASLDERINAGIAAFETALKANGKAYELFMYEGANHAFNNDTNAARYNKDAATLAWGRSVEFLKKHTSA